MLNKTFTQYLDVLFSDISVESSIYVLIIVSRLSLSGLNSAKDLNENLAKFQLKLLSCCTISYVLGHVPLKFTLDKSAFK